MTMPRLSSVSKPCEPPSSLPDCPAGITLITAWSLLNCAKCVPGSRPCGSNLYCGHPKRIAWVLLSRQDDCVCVNACCSREPLDIAGGSIDDHVLARPRHTLYRAPVPNVTTRSGSIVNMTRTSPTRIGV